MISFSDVIVGINKYRLDIEEGIDVLHVDNTKVREQQCAKLAHNRDTRDNDKVATLSSLLVKKREFYIKHIKKIIF